MAEKFLKINLQLFAEGGAGGASSASGTEGGQAATGVQADPAAETGVNADPAAKEDRAKAYAQFKAEYKAEFDAEVQGMMRDRLKKSVEKTAELEKKLSDIAPLIDSISIRYGIDASDAAALLAAYEADDSNYEKEAYASDSTVEQARKFNQLKRENVSLSRAEETRREAEAQADEERRKMETFRKWDKESEKLREIYPNFDFATEAGNEQFSRLVGLGVDLRTAYEVTHKDDIIRGAMQFTAQRTAEKVANSVKANGSRPSENGLSSQAAAKSGIDINSLTREQIDAYKKRAANGERIDFKTLF